MRISRPQIFLPFFLLLSDLVGLNLAFFTALYLRFYYHNWSDWIGKYGTYYFNLLLATNLIYLVLLFYYKEWRFPRRFKPPFVVPRVIKMMFFTMLASVMLIFLSQGLSRTSYVFHFSRPTLVAFWVLATGLICLGRFLFGFLQIAFFRKGFLQRPILLVGEGAPLADLERRLRHNIWFGARVIGRIAVRSGPPPEEDPELEILPDGAALAALIRKSHCRELFVAAPPGDLAQLFETVEAVRSTGAKASVTPDHFQLLVSHLLMAETPPVQDRTKEDLVYELYQRLSLGPPLELASVSVIGSKGIPATFGGIERHVAELTNRLAREGFLIQVYARHYYTNMEGRFQGVQVTRLPSVHTKHLDAISHSLFATLHTLIQPVDVAHYHAQGPSVLSWIPRLFGIRTVVTVHGLDWKREKWGRFATRCIRLGELASARLPNRTIAVSRSLQNYYRHHYGREIRYIPNGIPMKKIPPAKEMERQFGLKPRRFLLLVGRLVPEKGCHYLIEAFRKLDTEMELVIAGGSSHSDDYLDYLKRMASGDDRIRFLGYVYGETLEELYAHNYLYIQPSDLEGLSIALLEALSFGSAVLVSDIEENLEALQEEELPAAVWDASPSPEGPPHGFRFRRGDVEDLSRRLTHLLENPAEVETMRGKARDWIRRRYDWDRIARETSELYLEIANK
ncbi:MAG: glycosyltransferase [Candidatus Eisenbacteria bacterium]|nr:glycosyltransferase [Candidatus Eisenbacteria bacterium]